MKKYITLLMVFAWSTLFACSAYSLNEPVMPDSFSIKNCSNSGGYNCSVLLVNGKRQNALFSAHYKANTFYFVDEAQQKQIIFKFRGQRHRTFDSDDEIMHFDALDQQGNLIAKLQIFNVYNISSGLWIYQKNGHDLLAIADPGLFGTEQIVYVKDSTQMIAKLTRPLWTLSADSAITVVDKNALPPELSPQLLMASLTLYCTHFGAIPVHDDDILSAQTKQMLNDRLDIIVATTPGLTMNDSTLSSSELIEASNLLTQRYQQNFGESYFEDDTSVNRLEKLTRLINLGQDLLVSQTISLQEERAILQYLLQELRK